MNRQRYDKIRDNDCTFTESSCTCDKDFSNCLDNMEGRTATVNHDLCARIFIRKFLTKKKNEIIQFIQLLMKNPFIPIKIHKEEC